MYVLYKLKPNKEEEKTYLLLGVHVMNSNTHSTNNILGYQDRMRRNTMVIQNYNAWDKIDDRGRSVVEIS